MTLNFSVNFPSWSQREEKVKPLGLRIRGVPFDVASTCRTLSGEIVNRSLNRFIGGTRVNIKWNVVIFVLFCFLLFFLLLYLLCVCVCVFIVVLS